MSNTLSDNVATTPGHPTGERRVKGDLYPDGRTPEPAPAGYDPTVMSSEEAMAQIDDRDADPDEK